MRQVKRRAAVFLERIAPHNVPLEEVQAGVQVVLPSHRVTSNWCVATQE